MNPRVEKVTPAGDYTLLLEFTNGETRVFDMKPYLNTGIFKELKDMREFNSVKVPFWAQYNGGRVRICAPIRSMKKVCRSFPVLEMRGPYLA